MNEGYDLEKGRCQLGAAGKGRPSSKEAADGVEGGPQDSIHQELAGLFSQAQDRVEAVGTDSFFG